MNKLVVGFYKLEESMKRDTVVGDLFYTLNKYL